MGYVIFPGLYITSILFFVVELLVFDLVWNSKFFFLLACRQVSLICYYLVPGFSYNMSDL